MEKVSVQSDECQKYKSSVVAVHTQTHTNMQSHHVSGEDEKMKNVINNGSGSLTDNLV